MHTWRGWRSGAGAGGQKKPKIYVKNRFPCAPGLLPLPRSLQARTLSFNSPQCYQVMMTTLVLLCLWLSYLHPGLSFFFFFPFDHILGTLSLISLVFQGRPACLLKLLINTEAPTQTPLCASFLTYAIEWIGEKKKQGVRSRRWYCAEKWPRYHQIGRSSTSAAVGGLCVGNVTLCQSLRCFLDVSWLKIKTPGASWCSSKSQAGGPGSLVLFSFFSGGYSVRFCALPWRIRTTPVKPCRLPNQ